MKKCLLQAFIFMFSSTAFAQHSINCATDELRINSLKQNPELANAVIEREKKLEFFTHQFIAAKKEKDIRSDTALYIVPVVFHIIHNYGNENIANEQIYSAIDMLNKTFRKQRDDTASIVEVFKPLHADTRIEFRLAKRDPNGNCHSGINRIASSLSETGDHGVKNLVHWNPANYLNVYVVKNAAGLAGHAIFPSDADTVPEWDGIVLSHNYVGTIGTSDLTRSVAFAHECGHYLNLQHIWGGNNVPGYYFLPCADPNHDCNIDDGVDDTPRTIGWQSCNLSGASCNSPIDNVQNVMDYSYCNIMFTIGQKDRMQAALNSPIGNRNNLWQSANLIATGVFDAPVLCGVDFSSSKKVVCPGGTISFNNESYNEPFDSVLWSFEGGTPANSTEELPEVTYNTEGVYDVGLTVYSQSDSILTNNENFKIVVLSETAETSFPFSESFETIASFDTTNWLENSFDLQNKWRISNGIAYSGTRSASLANISMVQDTKDELYSPLIDLSQATELNIAFRYAFANKTNDQADDELLLQLNKDCSNFWLTKLTLTGTELETAPPHSNSFFPSSQQEWKQAVTNIPSSYFVDDFRFRVVFNAHGGNNVLIDDINIDIAAGVEENAFAENTLQLFPNPTTGKINVVLPESAGKLKEVKLLDSKGSLVAVFNNTIAIDISGFSNGLYFVIVETENGIYHQRTVKE